MHKATREKRPRRALQNQNKPAEKAEEPTENYISHFHKASYWEKIKNNDSEAKTKVEKMFNLQDVIKKYGAFDIETSPMLETPNKPINGNCGIKNHAEAETATS